MHTRTYACGILTHNDRLRVILLWFSMAIPVLQKLGLRKKSPCCQGVYISLIMKSCALSEVESGNTVQVISPPHSKWSTATKHESANVKDKKLEAGRLRLNKSSNNCSKGRDYFETAAKTSEKTQHMKSKTDFIKTNSIKHIKIVTLAQWWRQRKPQSICVSAYSAHIVATNFPTSTLCQLAMFSLQ